MLKKLQSFSDPLTSPRQGDPWQHPELKLPIIIQRSKIGDLIRQSWVWTARCFNLAWSLCKVGILRGACFAPQRLVHHPSRKFIPVVHISAGHLCHASWWATAVYLWHGWRVTYPNMRWYINLCRVLYTTDDPPNSIGVDGPSARFDWSIKNLIDLF